MVYKNSDSNIKTIILLMFTTALFSQSSYNLSYKLPVTYAPDSYGQWYKIKNIDNDFEQVMYPQTMEGFTASYSMLNSVLNYYKLSFDDITINNSVLTMKNAPPDILQPLLKSGKNKVAIFWQLNDGYTLYWFCSDKVNCINLMKKAK